MDIMVKTEPSGGTWATGALEGQRLLDQLWEDGTERGRHIASFLRRTAGDLNGKSVLDLGCATGGLTWAISAEGGSAVGVDNGWKNVSLAALRKRAATGRVPSFAQADALRLPFRAGVFQVVLMSGLLEWMGFAVPGEPPKVGQLQALREVHRILAPGGVVVIGIENRWFPKFLIRSPHQKLPLVLLLPARLAWTLPRWVFGAKVHERLYGARALKRLLHEAGLVDADVHIPFVSYQFPREIVHSKDRRGLIEAVNRADLPPTTPFESVARGGRWGRAWFRLIANLRIQSTFSPTFFAVARRPV